jgi:hypothetical protein
MTFQVENAVAMQGQHFETSIRCGREVGPQLDVQDLPFRPQVLLSSTACSPIF